jgi:hypothetical protein
VQHAWKARASSNVIRRLQPVIEPSLCHTRPYCHALRSTLDQPHEGTCHNG